MAFPKRITYLIGLLSAFHGTQAAWNLGSTSNIAVYWGELSCTYIGTGHVGNICDRSKLSRSSHLSTEALYLLLKYAPPLSTVE
jgi:hypothetical protein